MKKCLILVLFGLGLSACNNSSHTHQHAPELTKEQIYDENGNQRPCPSDHREKGWC